MAFPGVLPKAPSKAVGGISMNAAAPSSTAASPKRPNATFVPHSAFAETTSCGPEPMACTSSANTSPTANWALPLHQLGRQEEAERLLEKSLEQTQSARGAFWLGRVRTAKVEASGGDQIPPTLAFTLPATPWSVGATSFTLEGVARDNTYIATVEVNGIRTVIDASAPEVSFSQALTLAPGAHEILVAARDVAGNVFEEHVPVVVDTAGPVLSFDPLESGRLSGVICDPAGVASLHIAGNEIALETLPDGVFAFSAQAEPGASYEALDTFGNYTRGRIQERPSACGPAFPAPWTLGLFPQPLLFAAQSYHLGAVEGPTIRFLNMEEGQEFYMEEVVVAVDVLGETPIASLAIDDKQIQLLPGRAQQTVNHRITLEPGKKEIVVVARDAAGKEASQSITVNRVLTEVETDKGKLTVSLLGHVWEGRSPMLENEAATVQAGLEKELFNSKRFEIVDRSLLPEIMQELELNALVGSIKDRLQQNAILPAELFLAGSVRRDEQSMTVVLQLVSTETAVIMGMVDAAGPALTMAEIEQLIRDLALRVVQHFPRVQGIIADVSDNSVFSTLSKASGVQKYMNCIVFRGTELKNPVTGETMGMKTKILSNARVSDVQAGMSEAELLPPEGETVAVNVGDYIVTK